MSEDRELTESEKQEKKLRQANLQRKRKKRIKSLVGWLVVIFIVSLVLIWFLKMRSDSQKKIEEIQNSNRKIEYVVKETTFSHEIDISGHVEPYDILTAKFRSTGTVTGVFCDEGQSVKKGELLATIDDTKQQKDLKDIENQISKAKITGETKSLELLEMQKKSAANALDYTRIIAPFDGLVTSVNIVENDYFDAGSSAVTVIDRSKLKATVEIDEIDMQYIHLGQTAKITCDSLPGVALEAKIDKIPLMGKYNNATGISVVEVEIVIENPPDDLLPGFTFSGTISIEEGNEILMIPSVAVSTTKGGDSTVTVKKTDGSTETRKITVSYLGEGYCQVLYGLNENEVIIYDNVQGGLMGIIGGMF